MDLLKIPFEHPFKIEWKLNKSDLEALKTYKDLYIFASKIADVHYFFQMFPNGYNVETEGETWIFLQIKIGKNIKEVEAEYEITIESADYEECNVESYKESQGLGFMICKTDEFFDPENRFFVDDEVTIKINGILKFDRPLISKMPYPISTKWTIKAIELEALRISEENECLKTEISNIPSNSDIEYYYAIFPNGPDDAHRGEVYIGLFLNYENIENDKKIGAHIKVTVNSGAWSKLFRQSYVRSRGYVDPICSTADLFVPKKGYIVNEEMKIEIDGHLFVEKKDPEFKLTNKEISDTTSTQEKNFTIIVGENEIQINKELLADVSTVFDGMLQSGMKEAIEGKMEITDFPFKTVDAAVKLICGISPTFTLDDMLPLLVFSDKYDIQIIMDLVEDHLISPSNVCQLIHFSNLFNAQKLYEKSAEFLIKCSRDSIAVYDYDLIDKDMAYKIFSSTFPAISC